MTRMSLLDLGRLSHHRHCLWAFFVVFFPVACLDVFLLKSFSLPPSHLDQYRSLETIDDEQIGGFRSRLSGNKFETPGLNERAVVSSLFSESYTSAVLTLGHSLVTTQISARRVLMYVPERISPRSICMLKAVGWELHPIERIAPPDGGRGVFYRFVDNYSKLHLWTMDKIGIKTVIYLDADMLVRRNFDELWTLPFEFAAVPDVYGNKKGFALSFNSGMMFLRTSSAIFSDIISKITSDGYQHGEADQGLLNMYFAPHVMHLPYIYNANLMIKERNPALWQAIENSTCVIHYTLLKPFIEEERSQAKGGIWEPEMKLWDSAWLDVFSTALRDKC